MPSGSTPPRIVTSAGLRPSPGLSFPPHKFKRSMGLTRLLGGGERGRPPRGSPRPRRGPRSPPGPATSATHEAAIKGKRPQVAQPNLVIRPAGRRAARSSFLPELPVFRGARGGGRGAAGPFETPRLPATGGLARGRPRRARSCRSCESARRLQETPAREPQASARGNLSRRPEAICAM